MKKQQKEKGRYTSVEDEIQNSSGDPKKDYSPPILTNYGSLVDLTKNFGSITDDAMVGDPPSSSGNV